MIHAPDAWKKAADLAEKLINAHNAPQDHAAYVRSQIADARAKDPDGLGRRMLEDSIVDYLTPMNA